MSDRWKITLVNRAKRYRRITRKGGIHNRKYRDMLVPVGIAFHCGANAIVGKPDASLAPYFNPDDPSRPRIIEMHARTWAKIKAINPAFEAKADLFRKVEVVRDGVTWIEDVPL